MKQEGVTYKDPEVSLLNATPLWTAEVAGRTAYSSFDKSEHQSIRDYPKNGYPYKDLDIDSSELLTSLSWVHHHESVLELINLTFSIKGISRGVLQEHARHRKQSLTVKSTRYTMSSVLHAFAAAYETYDGISTPSAIGLFTELITELKVLVLEDAGLIRVETEAMYNKLKWQVETGTDFQDMMSKDAYKVFLASDLRDSELFEALEKCKAKRNVGDGFKHLVTDNWSVDLVCSFNLRSLKNYFKLRDSGAAWFQIKALAQEMQQVIPPRYLDLIVKAK